MRLLLIAFDFPPNPSPQSLRWAYLARELAALGHRIHVITADIPGYGPGGLPTIPDSVEVSRVYPGPVDAWLSRRPLGGALSADSRSNEEKGPASVGGGRLNWKGRWAERLKHLLSLALFPDYRAEWLPWAKRVLLRKLRDFNPDVVITSHEPACSLPLGLLAKKHGFIWLADLGDPVLAPYTARRWRKRAFRLERDVCQRADLISVTSAPFAQLLKERHSVDGARCFVVTQGFDGDHQAGLCPVPFDPARLELLYTGRFYSFRGAQALLDAVIEVDGVRLTIATPAVPSYLESAAASHPEKFRILGFVSHEEVLSLQRHCDLLINLANDDPVQVPGKIYEYLGAGRPIIHIGGREGDPTVQLVRSLGAGCSVRKESAAIRELLECRVGEAGSKSEKADERDELAVARHSWSELASLLVSRLNEVLNGSHGVEITRSAA